MEPITGYWFIDILLAIALYLWAAMIFGKWLKRNRSINSRPVPEGPPERRKITDPGVIYGVEQLLGNHFIDGDFEVRDGKVFLPVQPERLGPLANVLDNAAAHVARQRNPNSISIYYRDSVQDKFHLMPDIDFDILREAASVMRRVAADRKQSTRLYEGMTDDEKRSMARAILYSHWTRRGCPEIANKHRAGTEDHSPQHRLVVETINALYGIKGVLPQ